MEIVIDAKAKTATLVVPLQEPRVSKSGKSLLLASEGGKVMVKDLGDLRFQVNLYVANPDYVKVA